MSDTPIFSPVPPPSADRDRPVFPRKAMSRPRATAGPVWMALIHLLPPAGSYSGYLSARQGPGVYINQSLLGRANLIFDHQFRSQRSSLFIPDLPQPMVGVSRRFLLRLASSISDCASQVARSQDRDCKEPSAPCSPRVGDPRWVNHAETSRKKRDHIPSPPLFPSSQANT